MKKWHSKAKGQTLKVKGSAFHKFVKKHRGKMAEMLAEEDRDRLHEASGRTLMTRNLCNVWGQMEQRKRDK